MHVGCCFLFEGEAPPYDDLRAHIERRLSLVPRYRQRLAFVPFQQGRPVWVDDPHFNMQYHLRHAALPEPGTEEDLKEMAGRIFSQTLDRSKPLWEIYLIEGLEGGRFALIGKTHHCLVDGISGVDITTVMFDATPEVSDLSEFERPWIPKPLPTGAELLAQALAERASAPGKVLQIGRAVGRRPRKALSKLREQISGLGAVAWAGLDPAPQSPLNIDIGSHRRFEWVRTDLAQFKEIKNRLGGTVNDVVLAVVTGALRRFLSGRGDEVDGLDLKAMVPVSIRTEDDHLLGNKVTVMTATLPVGERDERERLAQITAGMAHIKDGGQAVGAKALTELTGFAPPTIASQAARLQSRQRFFNLLVTNIPGPQFPLYLLGRRILDIFPQVPLSERQAVAFAVLSYNGKVEFGLTGDYDAMDDLAVLAEDLRTAISELGRAAGIKAKVDKAKALPKASWIPSQGTRKRPATRKRATQA